MKTPLLCYSDFSGQVYIVTRYTDNGTSITAHRKHDVTEQFDSIIKKRVAYKRREKRGPIEVRHVVANCKALLGSRKAPK